MIKRNKESKITLITAALNDNLLKSKIGLVFRREKEGRNDKG